MGLCKPTPTWLPGPCGPPAAVPSSPGTHPELICVEKDGFVRAGAHQQGSKRHEIRQWDATIAPQREYWVLSVCLGAPVTLSCASVHPWIAGYLLEGNPDPSASILGHLYPLVCFSVYSVPTSAPFGTPLPPHRLASILSWCIT